MKTSTQKQELQKQYDALIIAIRGYIQDSKDFGFEPTELKAMQEKSFELLKQIEKL